MIAEGREPLGIEFIDAPSAFAAVAHEPRLLQHTQVLGNRRPRDRQPSCQFVDCTGMCANHLKDG